MQLRNGKRKLDAYHPTFDPALGYRDRGVLPRAVRQDPPSLALVSKLWRDASKPAAAYPLTFDFDASGHACLDAEYRVTRLLDNDEALSLPYERVVELLGEDC